MRAHSRFVKLTMISATLGSPTMRVVILKNDGIEFTTAYVRDQDEMLRPLGLTPAP